MHSSSDAQHNLDTTVLNTISDGPDLHGIAHQRGREGRSEAFGGSITGGGGPVLALAQAATCQLHAQLVVLLPRIHYRNRRCPHLAWCLPPRWPASIAAAFSTVDAGTVPTSRHFFSRLTQWGLEFCIGSFMLPSYGTAAHMLRRACASKFHC